MKVMSISGIFKRRAAVGLGIAAAATAAAAVPSTAVAGSGTWRYCGNPNSVTRDVTSWDTRCPVAIWYAVFNVCPKGWSGSASQVIGGSSRTTCRNRYGQSI